MSLGVTGTIYQTYEQCAVEWRIPGFSKLSGAVDSYFESPAFWLSDSCWCLSICQNGTEEAPDWIAVYLERKDEGSPKYVKISVAIKTIDGIDEVFEDYPKLPDENGRNVFGWDKFVQISNLLLRKSKLIPSGVLTVTCSLTSVDSLFIEDGDEVNGEKEVRDVHLDEEKKIRECKIVEKLQKDFENLLNSGDGCDVTIKVQSKEFPAHKNILGARSAVFKSMFRHEMVEKVRGVVDIDDCDPCTFPDFLNYLYSGRTQHISDDNVCQLYTTSDKYQVDELKEECVAFMKEHLSVGTVCDFLSLALRHSQEDLVDLCSHFFCKKVSDIVKTVKWQTFLIENPIAANELFLKFVSR